MIASTPVYTCRIPRSVTKAPASNKTNRNSVENKYEPKLKGALKNGTLKIKSSASNDVKQQRHRGIFTKVPPALPRNCTHNTNSKNEKQIHFVTVNKKPITFERIQQKTKTILPSQNSIGFRENLEQLSPTVSEELNMLKMTSNIESSSSPTEQMHLKIMMIQKRTEFDKLKIEVELKQNILKEMYNWLKSTHNKVVSLGEVPPDMPDPIERNALIPITENKGESAYILPDIFIDKINNIPTEVVKMCEEILNKRQDIIDWLLNLVHSNIQEITLEKLAFKIDKFISENTNMLKKYALLKEQYFAAIKETINLFKNMQVAIPDKKGDGQYRHNIRASQPTESLYIRANAKRVEELENELKSEKEKRSMFREKLIRSEFANKTNAAKITELETSLLQSNKEHQKLIHEVNELNDKMKMTKEQYENELITLQERLKSCSKYHDSISIDRDKTLLEKEELIVKLREYEKKLRSVEEEMDKLRETANDLRIERENEMSRRHTIENALSSERERKNELERELERTSTKLFETEKEYKIILKNYDERRNIIANAEKTEQDLSEATKTIKNFDIEISRLKLLTSEYEKQIAKLKFDYDQLQNSGLKLSIELKDKDGQIVELNETLAQKEARIVEYRECVEELREHLTRTDSIEPKHSKVECVAALQELVIQQRTKLIEALRQNGELAEALQQKEFILEQQKNALENQQCILKRKDELIKALSEKEDEQKTLILAMRNKLDMRCIADDDTTRQLQAKSEEIKSLLQNLSMRKKQIGQMETIILTLEKQHCADTHQKKKDAEKISMLEKMLTDNESKQCHRRNEDFSAELYGIINDFESDIAPRCGDTKSREGSTNNVEQAEGSVLHDRLREVVHFMEACPDMNSSTRVLLENIVEKSTIIASKDNSKQKYDAMKRRIDGMIAKHRSEQSKDERRFMNCNKRLKFNMRDENIEKLASEKLKNLVYRF